MSITTPVMLFAAGYGSRMAPLTDHLPKPMIAVAGKPLIGHALAQLNPAVTGPIVANTHHLAHLIEPFLIANGVQVLREPSLLDTGGGLKNALPLLAGDPVLTMNTDCVWSRENPVTTLLGAWSPARMDALLLLVPARFADGHSGQGDFDMLRDGQIQRGRQFVYSGVQILKTGRLDDVDDAVFSLNVVWDMMASDSRLFGIVFPGGWCDVGHPQGLKRAEAMLRRNT